MAGFYHKIDININDPKILSQLFGKLDENVKFIEKQYNIKIKLEDGFLSVMGADEEMVMKADKILSTILKILINQKSIGIRDIEYIIEQNEKFPEEDLSKPYNHAIVYSSTGKVIRPKTIGQKRYVDAIGNNNLTFGIGPAGTGKTYLAVAMAVKAFKAKEVARIILTRPAVEAGESLGFLPGDMQMKVDPYLRPLYDAIFDMLGADSFHDLVEKNIIEVAPLAYMRGRTLDNAYIIL
ncbi:MAG: phosphate starvation-inducible protein PhoH, partial [Tissierellia bacterium]|nr:phosphate starvation-inducible protein PhoH [Tissierellia bacterium]